MVTEQERTALEHIQPSILRVYAEVVDANVHAENWDEVWFALISLKGHLQSFPDFVEQTVWAAPSADGGNYRITIITQWHSIDALEVWLTEGWSVHRLLLAMNPPAFNIDAEVRVQVS